jgi:hypothetical protein
MWLMEGANLRLLPPLPVPMASPAGAAAPAAVGLLLLAMQPALSAAGPEQCCPGASRLLRLLARLGSLLRLSRRCSSSAAAPSAAGDAARGWLLGGAGSGGGGEDCRLRWLGPLLASRGCCSSRCSSRLSSGAASSCCLLAMRLGPRRLGAPGGGPGGWGGSELGSSSRRWMACKAGVRAWCVQGVPVSCLASGFELWSWRWQRARSAAHAVLWQPTSRDAEALASAALGLPMPARTDGPLTGSGGLPAGQPAAGLVASSSAAMAPWPCCRPASSGLLYDWATSPERRPEVGTGGSAGTASGGSN